MIAFLTNNKILKNIKSEEELIEFVTYNFKCQYLEEYEILEFENKNLDEYDDDKYFVRKDDSYILIEKITITKKGYLYDQDKIKYNILNEWKIIEVVEEDKEINNINKDNFDIEKIKPKSKNIIIGPIGCGKTTRIKEMVKYLINKNVDVKIYSDIDYSDIVSKEHILSSFDEIKNIKNTFIIVDKFKNTNKFRIKMRDEEIRNAFTDKSNGFIMSMTFPILISSQINDSIDHVFIYDYNRDFIMRILNRRYCPDMKLDEFKNTIRCTNNYELVVLDKKKNTFYKLDKF